MLGRGLPDLVETWSVRALWICGGCGIVESIDRCIMGIVIKACFYCGCSIFLFVLIFFSFSHRILHWPLLPRNNCDRLETAHLMCRMVLIRRLEFRLKM